MRACRCALPLALIAVPGYALTTWYGLFAAAATPRNVVARLHADVARALKLPDDIERLARDCSDVVASESAAFDAQGTVADACDASEFAAKFRLLAKPVMDERCMDGDIGAGRGLHLAARVSLLSRALNLD